MTALERLRADLARYFAMNGAEGRLERLGILLRTEAIWAIAAYRLGQHLRTETPWTWRLALAIPFALAHRAVHLAVGIYLDPKADIGPGLYVGHSGGVWVAPGTVIGSGCNLSQDVTIGVAGQYQRGVPILGDRVWVGPKATIGGKIRVGSGAVIGANSLVVSNVPENAVVLGVPARVLSYGGSAGLVR
jgi:serine O-acetyltransferase